MTKYEGICKCGHEGTIRIKRGQEDFKTQEEIDKAFSETLCKKCRYELKKKQEAECNEYIKDNFKALELPELEGTEKQIAWANKIREEMVDMWEKNLMDEIISPVSELISIKSYGPAFDEKGNGHKVADMLDKIIKNSTDVEKKRLVADLFISVLKTIRKASIYIDIETGSPRVSIRGLLYKAFVQLKINDSKEPKEVVISPENAIDERIVNIYSKDNTIYCESYADMDVKSICKANHYIWSTYSEAWYRNINVNASGSIVDRKTELANKILNAGYIVRVDDPTLKDKIINADYEPEHRRWIAIYEGKLLIAFDYNDYPEIKTAFKRIKGCETDRKTKALLVPVEMYLQVEDLADMYDFRFNDKSREEIEKIKATLEDSIADVKAGIEKKYTSRKQSIDEVYNELIDEES